MIVEAVLTIPLSRDFSLVIYGDDITLVSTDAMYCETTQLSLTLLDSKCQELGPKLNLLKTKAMFFGGPAPAAPLVTAGVGISWLGHHQYLGVWFDRRLTLKSEPHSRQN